MKTTSNTIDREEVNTEAHLMALDYIYYRLRKMEPEYIWQRCPELPGPRRPWLIMRELGNEFEERFAKEYGHMIALLQVTRFNTYQDFLSVCEELFRGNDYQKVDDQPDVKWGRIVALFVFGGVLAVKFVQSGLEDDLVNIANWIALYVRHRLSYWICKHGGWSGLNEYYEVRAFNKNWGQIKHRITGVGTVCGAVALAAMIAWRWSIH